MGSFVFIFLSWSFNIFISTLWVLHPHRVTLISLFIILSYRIVLMSGRRSFYSVFSVLPYRDCSQAGYVFFSMQTSFLFPASIFSPPCPPPPLPLPSPPPCVLSFCSVYAVAYRGALKQTTLTCYASHFVLTPMPLSNGARLNGDIEALSDSTKWWVNCLSIRVAAGVLPAHWYVCS